MTKQLEKQPEPNIAKIVVITGTGVATASIIKVISDKFAVPHRGCKQKAVWDNSDVRKNILRGVK